MRRLLCAALACSAAWLSGCSSSSSLPVGEPPRTYNLGEKVPAGHLTYTVFDTQWATHVGVGLDARVPQNRFLLIRLSAVNGGGSDASVPTFIIEDDKGVTYEELSDGEGVPQWIGYLRSAHPADFVQGNVVFDAPPAHYKLRLADPGNNLKALVDLPLSFNDETPPELGLPSDFSKPVLDFKKQ